MECNRPENEDLRTRSAVDRAPTATINLLNFTTFYTGCHRFGCVLNMVPIYVDDFRTDSPNSRCSKTYVIVSTSPPTPIFAIEISICPSMSFNLFGSNIQDLYLQPTMLAQCGLGAANHRYRQRVNNVPNRRLNVFFKPRSERFD
ncbi:hypothetical protein EVAR_89217_1 [Eumeta japonica]|uniref:Uncharacterized protein n=1 Tax=Eumeta variegata TaxID=151549 RepID=A0A4C2AC95_EUMVA|nr:hypothetical protein EVAR_89217_1 [Eumeta japonica]